MRSTVRIRLNNLGVAVTRPLPQGHALGQLVADAGGVAIEFPTIEVRAVPDEEAIARRLGEAGAADWYIFISVNAVEFGCPMLNAAGINPEKARVASMGPASSEALRAKGVRVDIECPPPLSSESLLSALQNQGLRGARVTIFRGRGGRERLRQGLEGMGATVDYVECYERHRPEADIDVLKRASDRGRLDVIVTTSVDGLANLIELIRTGEREELLDKDLLVVGARQARQADTLGWRGRVITVGSADNHAIVKRLEDLTPP